MRARSTGVVLALLLAGTVMGSALTSTRTVPALAAWFGEAFGVHDALRTH